MAKLSASGEWLLAESSVSNSGPVEMQNSSKYHSSSIFDSRICLECGQNFRACDCKNCLKCGTPFMTYFGTGLVKGRSHCRVCASPVCVTCIVIIKGLEKICTRCHLKQKEEEISTEKALFAICEAKFGLDESYANVSRLKTMSQKLDALFEAAKKGLDHIMLILFNIGCSIDSTDSKQNTPLFYAAGGGHLQCIVLLLEKGADVKAKNNVGWTPLHTAAWKGTTENHTKCVKYLIEMGADVLEESNTFETAGDVAQRCNAKKEIVEILRAAEVERTMREVEEKVNNLLASSPTPKEQHFCRLLTTLLNLINKSPELLLKETSKEINGKTKGNATGQFEGKDLEENRNEDARLCRKCKGPTSQTKCTLPKPTADVEPILRSPSTKKKNQARPTSPWQAGDTVKLPNFEELSQLKLEKKEWEDRCRKLMSSIAVSTKEHDKQITDLKLEMKQLREEKENINTKRDATYENKLAKLRQENDCRIKEMVEQIEEMDLGRCEVLLLQNHHNLTWVPDDMVKECQNSKCRVPFTKTLRKHHCRCCGRVFCTQCSNQKTRLDRFGYKNPVRVCNVCYALIDDLIP